MLRAPVARKMSSSYFINLYKDEHQFYYSYYVAISNLQLDKMSVSIECLIKIEKQSINLLKCLQVIQGMTMLLVCVVASWGTDWIREEIIITYLSMLNSNK